MALAINRAQLCRLITFVTVFGFLVYYSVDSLYDRNSNGSIVRSSWSSNRSVLIPPEPCKGVVFAMETTEYLGGGTPKSYILKFFNIILNLASQLHTADDRTVFRLILYSLGSFEPFHTNDYSQFRNESINLRDKITNTQYINGFNYIDAAANGTAQVIHNEGPNFQAAILFFGQSRLFDSSDDAIQLSASSLNKISRDIFVVDGPQSDGANPWLWLNFTRSPDRIISMAQDQSTESVAALIGAQMVKVVQSYPCVDKK